MKSIVVALIVLATGHQAVLAARLGETPMAKVVALLKDMKTKIAADGESEQASYDKFACWCEETLAEKAKAITEAKDKLEELENRIVKNKGGLGSGGATIAQLKKDIAENIASMKEATEVRNKENTEYVEEREETEQCVGALEAAIKVLTGAGTGAGKKGFLETLQQARLLSVVGGMKHVLKVKKQSINQQDLQVVQQFVSQPEEFMKGQLAAVQTGHNPFGDYAPQSTRIQGILKSMYDSFTTDLEKDNAEEADKQKSYEELKATKEEELEKLESSLVSETKTEAERTKEVADDKAMRDTTQEGLAADEDFFKSTKEKCEEKAKHWAQRSRLRKQEIDAIAKAIEILDSDEAKSTFEESTKFLQLSAVLHRKGDKHSKAYQKLRSLATKYHSLKLAQIAVSVKSKSTGHFDDVIAMIDKMIAELRAEELDDIAHRDRCEDKQNKNKIDKEDAEYTKEKAEKEIERLKEAIEAKQKEIEDLEKKMEDINKEKKEIKEQREKETEEFKKAQKADEEAIEILQEAKNKLTEYYRDTKAFVQVEEKPQPETNWQGGDYKGSKGEARGVIAIIDMLQEDLRKELKSQGQDEIDAQTKYEAERLSLTRAYRAAQKSKAECKVEKAELGEKKQDQIEIKEKAEEDIKTEEALAEDIKKDCDWVETHFEKRREARKAEIDGLVGAKDFLAGAGTDSDLEMPEF